MSESAVRGSRCAVAGVVSAAIKAGAPKAVLDAMRGEVAQHVADIESEVVAYSDRIRELESEADELRALIPRLDGAAGEKRGRGRPKGSGRATNGNGAPAAARRGRKPRKAAPADPSPLDGVNGRGSGASELAAVTAEAAVDIGEE